MSISITTNIGSIDERGFINGLLRKGFNLRNGLLELFANCLDANARNIHFQINTDTTRLIDDGDGMTVDNARNMASMHRENHSSEPKRGVSGLGAKPAMILMSDKKPVHVFTRKRNSDYLCITFPWDVIYQEGLYTGKVSIRSMKKEEETVFLKERAVPYGTTIEFPSNDSLQEAILDNFEPLTKDSLSTIPEDHLSVVFGADDVEVTCCEDSGPMKHLSKYNYFGEEQRHYYGGIEKTIIEYYQQRSTKENRFVILDGEGSPQWEIPKLAKGFATKVKPFTTNLQDFELVQPFEVWCGLRKDKTIFDDSDPKAFTGTDTPGEYNLEHLGPDASSRTFRMSNKVRRNNQIIGTFQTPDVTAGSARANGDSNFKLLAVQCEIRFNPVSNQSNPQDLVIGVQENKNKLDETAIPLNLKRLVKYCRDKKAQAIWDSFPAIVRGDQGLTGATSNTETNTTASEHGSLPTTPPSEVVDNGPTILDVFAQTESVVQVVQSPNVEAPVQHVESPVQHVEASVQHVEAPVQHDEAPEQILEEHTVDLIAESITRPVDVQGYRRGVVTGSELKMRWEQYLQRYHIADGTEYTGKHVELFNLIGDLLRE